LLLTYFLLSKSITGNSRKNAGHVVYVIELTDQCQKFGKNIGEKYDFFKIKIFDLNKKIVFFNVFLNS